MDYSFVHLLDGLLCSFLFSQERISCRKILNGQADLHCNSFPSSALLMRTSDNHQDNWCQKNMEYAFSRCKIIIGDSSLANTFALFPEPTEPAADEIRLLWVGICMALFEGYEPDTYRQLPHRLSRWGHPAPRSYQHIRGWLGSSLHQISSRKMKQQLVSRPCEAVRAESEDVHL